MDILNDEKITQLKIRKNLSKHRMLIYKIVFTHMYELTGKTPSELIKEAKEDETPYIENDKIIFKNINDRKITTYLYNYYEFLHKKKLASLTIKTYLSILRAFYNEYDIQLPKQIQLDNHKPLIREGDIPNIDDLRKGIGSTNILRNKAIILFLATSGVRIGDLVKFTIGDFVEATKEYHNNNNIDELLQMKRFNNIIPTWHFIPSKTKKKGNVCITFNTPESTELTVDYLKKRDNLSNENPLFEAENNFIHPATIQAVFRRINDRSFFKKPDGKRFFHAHALRKFFISTCNHNSSDLAKVNLLSGHSNNSTVHDTYNEINTEVMKRFYTKLIPYLSIRDTRVHDIKPAEMVKLENKVKILEEEKDGWKEELHKKNENEIIMQKQIDDLRSTQKKIAEKLDNL